MAQTEDVVFQLHPTATHLRYPRIYGPLQVQPREWAVVRRILDRRRRMIAADGGLTLTVLAYSVNAAGALLTAIDKPVESAGHLSERGLAVALAGGLAGRSQHRADRRPRMAGGTSVADSLVDATLGLGFRQEAVVWNAVFAALWIRKGPLRTALVAAPGDGQPDTSPGAVELADEASGGPDHPVPLRQVRVQPSVMRHDMEKQHVKRFVNSSLTTR